MARRHRHSVILALAAALALGGAACTRNEPGAARNAILISIDTLRADRLGLYGCERPTSPHLDAFAARGAVFDRVVAEAPWTLPSHVTMLSGLYPATHGVDQPSLRVGADVALLAEILHRDGFSTVGITDGGYVGAMFGLNRGFEVWKDTPRPFRSAVALAEHLIREQGERRWFLFLHTYQVHCPYTAPPSYGALFASPGAASFDAGEPCGAAEYARRALTPGNVQYLRDQYDAGIRQTDDELGAFLAALESRGDLANTVVIVTSDHGEELSEHGLIGHELSLHREVLMIPLIVVGPGVRTGRIAWPAGLVDVSPTLLGLLGEPVPRAMQGRDLAPLLRGENTPPWAAGEAPARISELQRDRALSSVVSGGHQLIIDRKTDRAELYDLRVDAAEHHDLAAESATTVAELRRALAAHVTEAPRQPERVGAVGPEVERRLRALGYVPPSDPGK